MYFTVAERVQVKSFASNVTVESGNVGTLSDMNSVFVHVQHVSFGVDG